MHAWSWMATHTFFCQMKRQVCFNAQKFFVQMAHFKKNKIWPNQNKIWRFSTLSFFSFKGVSHKRKSALKKALNWSIYIEPFLTHTLWNGPAKSFFSGLICACVKMGLLTTNGWDSPGLSFSKKCRLATIIEIAL